MTPTAPSIYFEVYSYAKSRKLYNIINAVLRTNIVFGAKCRLCLYTVSKSKKTSHTQKKKKNASDFLFSFSFFACGNFFTFWFRFFHFFVFFSLRMAIFAGFFNNSKKGNIWPQEQCFSALQQFRQPLESKHERTKYHYYIGKANIKLRLCATHYTRGWLKFQFLGGSQFKTARWKWKMISAEGS